MKHEISGEAVCTVTDTEMSFVKVLSDERLPVALKDELKKANILIIPYKGFRDVERPVFPEGTSDFYRFLRDEEKDEAIVDICADDGDYCELELHNDVFSLPMLIVTDFALPIIVGLILLFIEKVISKRSADAKIVVDVVVEKKDISKKIHYEGYAKDFKDIADSIKKDGFLK